MPIQVDGVLLRAMSGSELSRVRTELDPTAGTHHQARQFFVAFLASGSSPSRSAL
jgi:hypothetical protein